MTKTADERFWEKVHIGDEDCCWEWASALDRYGYGDFWNKNGTRKAHRFSWEFHYGAIPNLMCVCHVCDNRKCVSPFHMFLGTHDDNFKDMLRKGKHTGPSSENSRSCKLNESQVKEIRKRVSDGERIGLIASEFEVRHTTIIKIRDFVTWKTI